MLEIAVMGDLNIGNYDNFASLEAETLRVKSSLLYADQITLESPKVQLLLTRYGVRSRFLVDLMKEQGLTEEFIELMAERLEGDSSKKSSHKKAFIELLRGGDHSAFFEMLESAKEAMRSIDRRSIDPNMILQAWGPLALQYRLQSLQCTGGGYPIESARAFSDLIEMSKTGLLKVSTGATWDVFTAGSSNIAEAVDLAIYGISQSIASAEPVRHLLFSSAERLRLDPEVVTEESFELSLSNRAALAGSLVASLPSFPEAGVDEIMDLRDRILPYISRFRKAITELESELNRELARNDFAAAVADLRLRHVDPALEELREAVREEGAFPVLTRAIPTLSASTLALGAAFAVGAPILAYLAAVVAGASTTVAREIIERRSIEKGLRQNRLFFLFDAERFLKH